MKHQHIFIILLAALVFGGAHLSARTVRPEEAEKAALRKIRELGKAGEYRIKDIIAQGSTSGECLWYFCLLEPAGCMALSGDTDLPPVIFYSLEGENNGSDPYLEQLRSFLSYDLRTRVEALGKVPNDMIRERNRRWDEMMSGTGAGDGSLFEQWPPAGSTPTGGWLWENWKQSAPYNNFCPIDPVTQQRSVAGCPAVAMAMIVNYFEITNDTHFDDEDDYYHSYAGRNYWIDNDYLQHGFISFPQMNDHLDTLNKHWLGGKGITNDDKAALTFACGVACKQVYTSSISGTFGVNQAYDAYQRFGFSDAELMDETDTSLYTKLSSNMKDGMPVHLAVVDPAGTMGHNVVVDGYNTDDYYHINFGWGGSYNGWYKIPEEIPYGLTVIEGLILNIVPQTLNLRAYLEGPFAGGFMSSYLNVYGYLPTSQPYNQAPWYYTGTECVSSIPNSDVVDWVLIESRETSGGASTATGSTMIARQAAFLLRDGNIVGTDGESRLSLNVQVTQDLYVVVWHRNHLGIMSASPLTQSMGIYSYDFTTAAGKVYGGSLGHKELSANAWGMIAGDGDGSGNINNIDKNDVWAPQSGNSGYQQGDFSMNGQADNQDKIDYWRPNSGRSSQVPL
jgi:hypothetical protein